MTELTERLIARRDQYPSSNTDRGRDPIIAERRDLLTEAASRLTELEAENARLREALEDLIRWATLAFNGLEYEDDSEREELWEKLAGDPGSHNALIRARAALETPRE